MKPYKFHPQAAAEYADAKQYYSQIRSELGERFETEIDDLNKAVCQHHYRYREYDPPLRRHFSQSFSYAFLLTL